MEAAATIPAGTERHQRVGARNSQHFATDPEKILIVRLGSMGDIVHTLPAIGTLRGRFPRALIGWVLEERWAGLLCSAPQFASGPRRPERPLVDVLHVVHTRQWRQWPFSRRTRREFFGLLHQFRSERWQLALDFQSAIRSAAAAQLSGAPRRIGFSRTIETPASLFYTQRVEAVGRHVVEQNNSLAVAAAPDAEPSFDFQLPRDAGSDAWAGELLDKLSATEFCLISPGAGWGAKRWPAERFAQVARALHRRGVVSLVNYGPGEEALAQAVEAASGGLARAVGSNISRLIALLRRASLCLGGDTGPTHLAAALGVPVVAIYGPTDPARNGPFGAPCIVLRSDASMTDHARRAETEAGLMTISAEQVIAATDRILGARRY